jgi:mRNA-degrading endonuclease RelE of RelBE toxin-antitoxin system
VTHDVRLHPSAERVLEKNADLRDRWPTIRFELEANPYPVGTQVKAHLKHDYYCSFRYKSPPYRIIYDVHREQHVVYVFTIIGRGDAYRRRGKGRRR